jgi:hypothetical protein
MTAVHEMKSLPYMFQSNIKKNLLGFFVLHLSLPA